MQISFVCLPCGATADLNPRSRCIHSALTPAPESVRVVQSVFVKKRSNKICHKFSSLFFLFPKAYNPFVSSQSHGSQSACFFLFVCFFVDFGLLPSPLALSSGPLFVCVYVIAWQGSAPSRLCEGLNVIHWAETVSLPPSLPVCLSILIAG